MLVIQGNVVLPFLKSRLDLCRRQSVDGDRHPKNELAFVIQQGRAAVTLSSRLSSVSGSRRSTLSKSKGRRFLTTHVM